MRAYRPTRPTARHIHIHILFLPDPVPFIIETGKLSNQFSSWNEKQPINDHEHDSDWVGQWGRSGGATRFQFPSRTELTRLALFPQFASLGEWARNPFMSAAE